SNNYSNTPSEWWHGQTHAPDIAVLLNQMGLEGWELVNANVYGSGNVVDNNAACFFKRRKP
ncbi:MAG TPA: hypothetical protein VFX24_07380, partial [Ktedonobacterales bacterium]|nr:hypothetical protein [Ktedonobacterales bacterium]